MITTLIFLSQGLPCKSQLSSHLHTGQTDLANNKPILLSLWLAMHLLTGSCIFTGDPVEVIPLEAAAVPPP